MQKATARNFLRTELPSELTAGLSPTHETARRQLNMRAIGISRAPQFRPANGRPQNKYPQNKYDALPKGPMPATAPLTKTVSVANLAVDPQHPHILPEGKHGRSYHELRGTDITIPGPVLTQMGARAASGKKNYHAMDQRVRVQGGRLDGAVTLVPDPKAQLELTNDTAAKNAPQPKNMQRRPIPSPHGARSSAQNRRGAPGMNRPWAGLIVSPSFI